MSAITTPTRKGGSPAMKLAGTAADEADSRFHPAGPLRRQINKVFPTHWSFMLGEINMYAFIVLLLSGTWLAVFYDPSMAETTYDGAYAAAAGRHDDRAYESTLDISFDVRGGLFIRQVHHWAALLFVAAMIAHMMRTFFTGAFRRPRETNWVLGVVLLLTGMIEGFIGYSLPDDLLSGTGIRTGVSAIVMSIPVIGTWLQFAIFGGEYPGDIIIPRLYIVHVFLLPGIITAVIAVHVALVWFQKHTQFPGPGPHRAQRRRRPHPADVRHQGRRLHRRLDRPHGGDGRPVPDQPDLEPRPVQPGQGLGGLAARLVHGRVRRRGPTVAVVGDVPVRPVHDPGDLLPGRDRDGHPDHAAGALPDDRAQADRRRRPPQPAAAPA